jgi:N-formylglutamate deformylase
MRGEPGSQPLPVLRTPGASGPAGPGSGRADAQALPLAMGESRVETTFLIRAGNGSPIAATALHDGHALRAEVYVAMELGDEQRRREEDPHTGPWAEIVETSLIALRSRFEVDLNRPRERAVYLEPDHAWGLHVWRAPPAPSMITTSLAQYDAFYAAAARTFAHMCRQSGRFVVLDFHSYNHRRDGPTAPPADPATHPEVNIGTSNMDRRRWAPVVDGAIAHLRTADFMGRRLDVRENVKFRGGHFPRWVHDSFPAHGCAIAIEFRKSFMDEWTGTADATHLGAIRHVLAALVPKLEHTLKGMGD